MTTELDVKTMAEQQFFGEFADDWWADDSSMNNLRSFNPVRFRFFEPHVDRWVGKKVLDVGCGGGFTTEYLAARGCEVSGVDASEDLIGAARRHDEQVSHFGVDYSVGVAEQLPYASESFDIVTCVDVLEHVVDYHQALVEIHRVLRPGGLFMWDTINRTPAARLGMIWLPENVLKIVPKGAHQYEKFIRPAELSEAMALAGLRDIDGPVGIQILGQRKDGSLRLRLSRDRSATYMGVSQKPA